MPPHRLWVLFESVFRGIELELDACKALRQRVMQILGHPVPLLKYAGVSLCLHPCLFSKLPYGQVAENFDEAIGLIVVAEQAQYATAPETAAILLEMPTLVLGTSVGKRLPQLL